MRLKRIKAQAEYLFAEKILIADAVQQEAQHRIGSPTGRIPESLQRQPFFERLVKKINNIGNPVMNHSFFLLREDNYCPALSGVNNCLSKF